MTRLTDNTPKINEGRGAYRSTRHGLVPAAPDVITPGAVRVGAKTAEKFLGLRPGVLAGYRSKGTGPAWYWHMGRIAYDVAELERYAAERKSKVGA